MAMQITFDPSSAADRQALQHLAAALESAFTAASSPIKQAERQTVAAPEVQTEIAPPAAPAQNHVVEQPTEEKPKRKRSAPASGNWGGRKPTQSALQARQAIRNLHEMRWKPGREGFTSLELAKHLGCNRSTAHNALEWMAANNEIVYKAGLAPKAEGVKIGKQAALWRFRYVGQGQ